MLKTITTELSMSNFTMLLKNNPGFLIIKLGAEWCEPCKRIEKNIEKWFSIMPNYIQTVLLDIDISCNVYSHLKKKRMLNGIPAILLYIKGNDTIIPDEIINSSNINEIDTFFKKFTT